MLFDSQKKKADKDWLEKFPAHHPKLSRRQPKPTSLSRATDFNKPQVDKFFSLLIDIKAGDNIAVSNIYHLNETGFSSAQKPRKVLALKGAKQIGK